MHALRIREVSRPRESKNPSFSSPPPLSEVLKGPLTKSERPHYMQYSHCTLKCRSPALALGRPAVLLIFIFLYTVERCICPIMRGTAEGGATLHGDVFKTLHGVNKTKSKERKEEQKVHLLLISVSLH